MSVGFVRWILLDSQICALDSVGFAEYLTSVRFVQRSADPCIYVQDDDCLIVIAAYVNDLIIATKTEEDMQQVKELLQSLYE